MRNFDTYVGVDLGGARGKTTAVAVLCPDDSCAPSLQRARVVKVASKHPNTLPWTDDILLDYLLEQPTPVVAINAPLSLPACLRCQLQQCPGISTCVEPAVKWLRTKGVALANKAHAADQLAATPSGHNIIYRPPRNELGSRLAPYTHRCTEVALHYEHDNLLPREYLGQSVGPLAARGQHLRKSLARSGFTLGKNLIEVMPKVTIQALFGRKKAIAYKRGVNLWATRASILEGLYDSLSFAPESRISREKVLQNDHCFDALLSAYSAFLWARNQWPAPQGEPWASDGFICAPPKPAKS